MGGCQRRKLVFVVTGWYRPYLHIPPFVINEQYGEGEMSWVVIIVSVYYLFVMLICTYYLSSGSRLIITNHRFVCHRLAYFNLPSLFVHCWIFCIFVLLGWSIKKDILTLDLQTTLKIVAEMTIDDMGCLADAKFVFHQICKNIEFIQNFKKVRLTKVLCNILSCILLLHFCIPINHMPRSFYHLSVMFS